MKKTKKMKNSQQVMRRPVILLPMIAITFLLGLWQCFRLESKNTIIDTQLANQAKPAIPWVANPDLTVADRGIKYIVRGKLFPDKTIYVLTLAPDESEIRGYQPTMPFLTTNNEWLFLSVGFYRERVKKNITSDIIDRDAQDYLQSLGGKTLTLTIYSDPIRRQGMFTPDNIIDSKIWFYLNKKQLAARWQLPDFLLKKSSNDFVFKVAKLEPAAPKISDQQPVIRFFDKGLPTPYNRHGEYIATWWLLSFFGFLLYWFGKGKGHSKSKGEDKSKRRKKK